MRIVVKKDGIFMINTYHGKQEGACYKGDEFIINAEIEIQKEPKVFTIDDSCIISIFQSPWKNTIKYRCPFCGEEATIPALYKGKKIRCCQILAHSHAYVK